MPPFTTIVLTGGRSSRLGQDKASTPIAGQPMLIRVLTGVPQSQDVIVVGPPVEFDLPMPVRWTREEPPGGGPVAALAAAIDLVRTEIVLVLATDLPFLGTSAQALPEQLTTTPADAVLALDQTGHAQALCAAYRTEPLRAALATAPAAGRSMRSLIAHLASTSTRLPSATVDPTWDIDTPADLAAAQDRAGAHEGVAMMQDWINAVAAELGGEPNVNADLVLDVAKDVAHQVQRPAAPLTTYLLGVAVGSGMPLEEAAAKITNLAVGWSEQD